MSLEETCLDPVVLYIICIEIRKPVSSSTIFAGCGAIEGMMYMKENA